MGRARQSPCLRKLTDDITFPRLANRATRMVGYPVAMNAYLAYAQAKQTL